MVVVVGASNRTRITTEPFGTSVISQKQAQDEEITKNRKQPVLPVTALSGISSPV